MESATAPVPVHDTSGDVTAIAIDADASVPLVGAGTVAWSPRDARWAVTLGRPRGTVRFQITDGDLAAHFHDAVIAAGELALTKVTFRARTVPRADVVRRADHA